jgi:hypothetical protein
MSYDATQARDVVADVDEILDIINANMSDMI